MTEKKINPATCPGNWGDAEIVIDEAPATIEIPEPEKKPETKERNCNRKERRTFLRKQRKKGKPKRKSRLKDMVEKRVTKEKTLRAKNPARFDIADNKDTGRG